MTRVKICGITCLEDALAAVDAGADAIGFVFAESPRRIAPRDAGEIVAALPPFVRTVGVTMDADTEQIEAIVRDARVDVLQFHGDESPADCRAQARPVLKRIGVAPEDDRESLLARAGRFAGIRLLVDPGRGDGLPFDFALAAGLPRPFVLAGGLDPLNVSEAMRKAHPYGIDVCSGVESAPGRKDPERMRALVGAVRLEDASNAA